MVNVKKYYDRGNLPEQPLLVLSANSGVAIWYYFIRKTPPKAVKHGTISNVSLQNVNKQMLQPFRGIERTLEVGFRCTVGDTSHNKMDTFR
jgi:hypothetical protein